MEFKKFKSIKEMNRTPGTPGQYGIIKDRVYKYVDNQWRPFDPSGEQLEIAQNAYLMAKTVAAQAPILTEEQIEKSKRLIYDFLQEYKHTKYFMLLLKELSYYTLFVSSDSSDENMSDAIIECLSNLGNIIDINNESEAAIEVWIKDSNEEAHIGYFFPYDQGVIECRLS